MKLSEKIVRLRKSKGWSQEDLAQQLNVSRQAISRWEGGTAQPDAGNVLQLSNLFGVTTDYLLKDDYESDDDLPKVKQAQNDGIRLVMIAMVTLEVMILILQYVTMVVLQNDFFGVCSFIPFAAVIGGFEYGYQKRKSQADDTAKKFRRRFYQISAWLGLYFPIRFVVHLLAHLYPRPYSTLVRSLVVLAVYGVTAALVCRIIRRKEQKES